MWSSRNWTSCVISNVPGIGSNTCNRQSIFTFRNFISSNMLFYLRFHPWIIWKQNFSFHFTVEEVILKASLEALVLLHEAPIVGEISGLIELLFCTLGTGLSCFVYAAWNGGVDLFQSCGWQVCLFCSCCKLHLVWQSRLDFEHWECSPTPRPLLCCSIRV